MTTQRNTRQKQAIRTAFDKTERPLSPEEILQSARDDVKGLSLATVYRNLSALVDEGWLQAVEIPGIPPRYERAGKEHHHHFHCNVCGKVYEVSGCAVQVKPKLPRGFHVTGHEFSLFGECPDCR
jgi:Fur family ferric uptake transcriptional regulator